MDLFGGQKGLYQEKWSISFEEPFDLAHENLHVIWAISQLHFIYHR